MNGETFPGFSAGFLFLVTIFFGLVGFAIYSVNVCLVKNIKIQQTLWHLTYGMMGTVLLLLMTAFCSMSAR